MRRTSRPSKWKNNIMRTMFTICAVSAMAMSGQASVDSKPLSGYRPPHA
jgi:hypothetical protein